MSRFETILRPIIVILLLIGGIAAVSIPAMAVPSALSITVDRTDDPAVTAAGTGAAACTAAASDCSLRGATLYANANPGTTIHLPAGNYQLTIDGNSEAGLCSDPTTGDLDISGNNTSISGAGASTTSITQTTPNDRVICVDANLAGSLTFSISSVTIGGGRETHGVGGGGMLAGATGDVTNISGVVFSNNQVSGSGSPDGGGLANAEGSLTITSSRFSGNQSAGSGGGLYFSANGGGGSLSVTGSTFTNNISTGGDGGGIKTTSSTASYTISKSVFSGNQAQGPAGTGGAVDDESGTLAIDHSTFTSNQVTASDGRGGAVGSADGAGHNVTITFSRFTGNTAATAANGKALYGGSGSTMTANDSWWGVNTGPAASDRAGTTTVANYLVLSVNPAHSSIYISQTNNIMASFLKDSANNILAPGDLYAMVGVSVTWGSAVKGTLSNQDTTIKATGTAVALFTPNATGAGSAAATVYSQLSTASFTIINQKIYLPYLRK